MRGLSFYRKVLVGLLWCQRENRSFVCRCEPSNIAKRWKIQQSGPTGSHQTKPVTWGLPQIHIQSTGCKIPQFLTALRCSLTAAYCTSHYVEGGRDACTRLDVNEGHSHECWRGFHYHSHSSFLMHAVLGFLKSISIVEHVIHNFSISVYYVGDY